MGLSKSTNHLMTAFNYLTTSNEDLDVDSEKLEALLLLSESSTEISYDSDGLVKSGTPINLLNHLIKIKETTNEKNHKEENEFENIFMTCHHYFWNPEELLNNLLQSYIVNSSDGIIEIICDWLENSPWELHTEDMMNKIESFSKLIHHKNIKNKLVDKIEKKRKESSAKKEDGTLSVPRLLKRVLSSNSVNNLKKRSLKYGTDPEKWKTLDVLEFRTTEFAQQLAYREHKLFRSIPIQEFLNQAWTKSTNKKDSPHLVQYIDEFNRTSFWVGTEIVLAATDKLRANTIRAFISIAKKCYAMNNFNSAMEICTGLNMASISRLKRTWKLVPDRYIKTFNNLSELISPVGNFHLYREILQKKDLPINPYIALSLRDLSVIEMNNETFTDNDEKSKTVINFQKLRLIYPHFTTIQKLQSTPYVYEPNPVIQTFLDTTKILNEEQIWSVSKVHEPFSHREQRSPSIQ